MSGIELTGIILKSSSFFEKDRRLTILTKENGRITALVRGGSNSQKKWGARIEPLNLSRIQASKGKSFIYINQCDILESYPRIRNEFERITLALYWVDIILKGSSQGQENRELFYLVHKALKMLGNDDLPVETIKDWFHYQFLTIEGLLPENRKNIGTELFHKIFYDYTGKTLSYMMSIGV